ncbi:MAG: HutD family protein [Burkholderiales bacterium]|nr:HutD family protein [Burkholderiales bacterium]
MTLHVVRCDAVEPQPWKNGGGLTRELLAWPAGHAWSLRISVADIGADGPFSAFPGVERWFAVLEGAGVLLSLPDGRRMVQADSVPLKFRGETAPRCELLDGPTRDLNLMIMREAGRGGMQRAHAGEDFAPHAAFRALFSADALTLQIDGADAARVPAMSLLWADGGAHGVWRLVAESPPRAWWIHFEPSAT